MSRPLLPVALVVVAVAFVQSASAQTPPAPTATGASAPPAPVPLGDVDVHERLARMEETAKTRQEEIKRLQDDEAKLKERLDGFWTALFSALGLFTTALLGVGAFLFPRLRKRIVEDGRHENIKGVLEEVLKDEPARVTKLFAAQRDEIARLLLAKGQPILLDGDTAGRDEIRAILEKVGYTKFVDKAHLADFIVLVGKATCEKKGRDLLERAFSIKPQPVVLYSAGPARIDDKLLADLNQVTVAVTANFPATVVMHLATLAMLTQRLSEAEQKA